MAGYPESEPFDSGLLEVEGGNLVYWELCGNPNGKPAVVFHGGPGSGCSPWWRTLFDPLAYRVVLFDQRNCGRSRPHASDPTTDLGANTTQNLIADAELLRERLGIERWLVLGGSWGSTLGLAYAETHAERVTEIVLCAITTGRHAEFDWLFRGGLARFFPEQWAQLVDALPEDQREDVVAGYNRLLNDADPEVRRRAVEAWCLWESATPDWPPSDGLAERFRGSRLRAGFRTHRHALRPAQRLARRRDPAPQRGPAAEHPGRARPRPVRLPGAARERLRARPRLARGEARRRRRGRPHADRCSRAGDHPCDRRVPLSLARPSRRPWRESSSSRRPRGCRRATRQPLPRPCPSRT